MTLRLLSCSFLLLSACEVAISTQPPEPAPSEPTRAPVPPRQAQPRAERVPALCDQVHVRLLGVDPVRPVMLHLPEGGWRARLLITNDNDRVVGFPPISSALFADRDRVAIEPQRLPGEGDWFMPFDVPSRGAREVAVLLGPEWRAQGRVLDVIEVGGIHPRGEPFSTCSVEATGLSGR